MTVVRKWQVGLRNHYQISVALRKIAKHKGKGKKPFVFFFKLICKPLFFISMILSWVINIPILILVGIGSVFEYLLELVDDLYRLIEDITALTLIKLIKWEKSKEESE